MEKDEEFDEETEDDKGTEGGEGRGIRQRFRSQHLATPKREIAMPNAGTFENGGDDKEVEEEASDDDEGTKKEVKNEGGELVA